MMFKFSKFSFIVLSAIYFTNAAKSKGTDSLPTINENLPLILVKGHFNLLELPTGIEVIKTGLLRKKKIVFTVPPFTEQMFFCPAETDKQKKILKKAINIDKQRNEFVAGRVHEHCLFRKKKKSGKNSIPSCKEIPQPQLMETIKKKSLKTGNENVHNQENNNLRSDSDETPCGPSNVGKKFFFGYQICLEFKGWGKTEVFLYKITHKNEVYPLHTVQIIHMYEVCYQPDENEVMHTFHAIKSPLLLSNPSLEPERQKLLEMETYNFNNMPSMNFKEIQTKFKEVENRSAYKIQFLVPPDDFSLVLWRRPAHHYVNTNLMHEKLQSCWNRIHEKIRDNSIKSQNNYQIHTGAFKLSSEKGDEIRIEEIEIPKIWIKVVHLFKDAKRAGIAIVANNYRDTVVNELITHKYGCEENLCASFIEKKCSQIFEDIRCCVVTEEIQTLFGIQFKFEKILSVYNIY